MAFLNANALSSLIQPDAPPAQLMPNGLSGVAGFANAMPTTPPPSPVTDPAQMAAPAQPQSSSPYHGFGGTLGKIGDAMLAASGQAPLYGPRKQQEQLGNALAGFFGESSPLAPIARIAPGAALTLRDEDQKYRTAGLEQAQKVQAAAMQYLGAAQDQPSYDRAKARVAAMYRQYGMNPDDLGLPDAYSSDAINEARLRGTSPQGQLTDDRENRSLDWRIQDDLTDDSRADRNTDDLIADRAARRSEDQRFHNLTDTTRRRGQDLSVTTQRRGQDLTDARGRRGQDLTATRARQPRPGRSGAASTAPTATGPNGEKIRWDGKAWVPAA